MHLSRQGYTRRDARAAKQVRIKRKNITLEQRLSADLISLSLSFLNPRPERAPKSRGSGNLFRRCYPKFRSQPPTQEPEPQGGLTPDFLALSPCLMVGNHHERVSRMNNRRTENLTRVRKRFIHCSSLGCPSFCPSRRVKAIKGNGCCRLSVKCHP